MGGWGSGKGQSKRQGSERGGPRAGTWEAPPIVFSSLMLLLLSPSLASSAKAAASHPGGILVWEPAPPYQERWPETGRDGNITVRSSNASDPAAESTIEYGGPGAPCTRSWSHSSMCLIGHSVEGLTKVKTVIKSFTITQLFLKKHLSFFCFCVHCPIKLFCCHFLMAVWCSLESLKEKSKIFYLKSSIHKLYNSPLLSLAHSRVLLFKTLCWDRLRWDRLRWVKLRWVKSRWVKLRWVSLYIPVDLRYVKICYVNLH